MRWVRTCQACGHKQTCKSPKAYNWRELKCKRCASLALDYGKEQKLESAFSYVRGKYTMTENETGKAYEDQLKSNGLKSIEDEANFKKTELDEVNPSELTVEAKTKSKGSGIHDLKSKGLKAFETIQSKMNDEVKPKALKTVEIIKTTMNDEVKPKALKAVEIVQSDEFLLRVLKTLEIIVRSISLPFLIVTRVLEWSASKIHKYSLNYEPQSKFIVDERGESLSDGERKGT
jgi:hypothetical protein